MKGMSASSVPKTSQRLLAEIGANAESPRWAEFVARYRPMMERLLATRFPLLAGLDEALALFEASERAEHGSCAGDIANARRNKRAMIGATGTDA